MNGNDVMRRLRYALNITDLKVLELFALAGRPMSRAELEPFFLREEEAGYVECPDEVLAHFLDGLIVSRRGVREEKGGGAAGPAPLAMGMAGVGAAGLLAGRAAGLRARGGAGPHAMGGAAPALQAAGAAAPHLSNNEVLKRLRIALELKDEDLIAIMKLAGVAISKSELSAFFRKREHPNWRPCGDQFLRNFLSGLTAKYRV